MPDIKQTGSAFLPVQCTEENMFRTSAIDGHIYFTTDTQKLFMGHESKFMEMCAAKGFYYGQKNIEYDDSGNEPDPTVDFFIEEIEGGKLPEVDDLILNIDGCFYRVTSLLDTETVRTTRLTLQGTGGSGGGGGGGGTVANLRISHYGGQNKYFSSEAKEAELGVIAYSDDTANYISSIECSFDQDFTNNFLVVNNLTHELEKPYYVDISKQLNKISSKGTKIYLKVIDKYGASRSIFYTVSIASLQLTTSQSELFGVTSDTFDYRCTVGGSLDLESRIIHYDLYDENGENIYSTTYELESNQIGTITRTINLSSVGHGSYTLKVKIAGIVSGTDIVSNELVHKLLRYQSIIGQPIFSALIPEVTEQYTDIPISYLLVFGDNVKQYAVDIIINDKVETTQILTAGTISGYTLNFDKQGTYNLKLNIDELGVSYTDTLNVTKYTGTLPVINIDRDDLKIYLTAKGRTNNAADKEFWPDYKNANLKGELTDFYYRSVNGWLIDENNVNYLKVSQGAKVVFDDYSPFGTQPKTSGLTIELDFRLSGVLDYDAHLIECLSYDNVGDIKTGFFITGNTFNYWASGKELISLNIVEGERIKLSYVIEPLESQKYPMCYTYLNGIISDVHNYQATDDFVNNPQKPGYLKIDSTQGQIDVYSVRFYSSALDAQTVLNNYQATLDTLEMRQASYEQNLIRNINGDIDLELIEFDGYNLQIPYVKIYGGYQADKKFVMASESEANVPALPVGKKDYRAIDIEMVYPKANQNSYFRNYKDFKVTTTFEDASLNVMNGFGATPTIGAIMYAQGTSSLEYPVKNLRVKLKGAKFTVRPDIEPVELVTFKADFMESAGAHNTGAANFVDTVYDYVDMQTPGQAQFEDESIVTCIKGHPCVIFWNPGVDENGNTLENVAANYHYIGKYNFNLDKATPEPFGFKEDPTDEKFGFLTDENGNLVLKDGEKQNSIFCFEFLDNNEKVCNFLSDATSNANPELTTEVDRYYDTWYGTRINADNEEVPGWTIGFESRHPEDKVGLHDADALWPLASWLNELYAQYQSELASGLKPSDITNIYEYTVATSFNANVAYYEFDEAMEDYKLAYPNEETFADGLYYTRKIINTTYAMDSIRRFKDEYQEYLDPEFLLAYYVITEALLMADSRVKNMMIATWGKEHRTFKTSTGEKSVYNYIWYPIFYDMDTMLGLDNTGHVNKNYFDEDTDPGVFNGDEVLWIFVRDALPQEIAQFYSRAEQANGILTKNGILPFFNSNQANMANETFYNEDAFYKYIDTFRNGYTDHLNDKYIAPGTGERLYAAQGSRSMMREYFIENRIKYLRGKYSSTGYQSGDRIEFRINYPKDGEGKDEIEKEKFRKSIAAVPPSGDFHFSSLKTGFAGVKVGQNGVPVNRRFVDEEDITISVDTSGANGTEAYLLGVSNLSSIGDVSDKYLQNLIVGTTDNRLKSLIMGNHHKDYYNPYWHGVNNIGLNGFTYLEEFNLENCESFVGALDFTDCAQIKKILLNGSGSTSLILPPSGVINELRIPTSINNFAIDSHPTLAADKFTIGYFDYEQNQYVNDYTRLVHISVKNTPIDSYGLAHGAILAPAVTRLESYCFQDVNWEITDVADVTIENNEIIAINILERLSNDLVPYDGINSHAEALTGNLIINVGNYNINEYALYNKYYKIYPNLNITYISTGLQNASMIKFYNSETIIGEPYYTVLTDGTETLAKLISAEGPNGVALTAPIKMADKQYNYYFDNLWTVAEAEEGSILEVGKKYNQNDFDKYIPNKNITFVANFSTTPTLYDVILYDSDGVTKIIDTKLTWHDNLVEEVSKNYPYQLYYNHKEYVENPEDNESMFKRYALKGWQSKEDFDAETKEPTWNDLKTIIIENNFIAYAYYEEEDCRYVPSNEEYFNITTDGIVSLADEYKPVLKGKISVPGIVRNITVKENGLFNSLITHIFFLGNSMTAIGANKLSQNNKLEVVYMPDSVTEIKAGAFQQCINLKTVKLSNNITTIGQLAFNDCSSLELNKLPDNLKIVERQAFEDCSKINISEFKPPIDGGTLTLKVQCFKNAGINNIDSIEIYEGVKCNQETFLGYGASRGGLLNAYFENYHPDIPIEINGQEQFPYGVTAEEMGINGSVEIM